MKKFFFLLLIVVTYQITTAQNVGIGTNTPTEKLQVTGNIKADTIKPNGIKLTPNAGNGKILISDAAGVGTWQASSVLSGAGNIGYGVWGDCATNGNISEYQPVADATGTAGDWFGISVSISGNYAIVGAYQDDVGANTDQGSASIYQWDGGSWVLMQKITDATGAANDNFGTSVSISGNYAIIGSNEDDIGANSNQGSASIYQWNGSSWVLMQKITDASGEAQDFFGHSVAISGNYAIVGAPQDNVGTNVDQGSAIIYVRFGSVWVLHEKITNDDIASFDNFGHSVAISGSYAIIGAYFDDIDTNPDQGSARIYKRNGTSWDLMKKITDATGEASDLFGYSVAISEDYAIIGAWNGNVVNGTQHGTANIYLRVGFGWQLLQKVVDPGSLGQENFGNATAIEGNTKRFVCGASLYGVASGKVVFGKIN